MNAVLTYAKAHVALVGAAATWAVATFPPHSWPYRTAAAVLALLTALGVWRVPNKPRRRAHDAGYTLIEVLIIVLVVLFVVWLIIALRH